MVCISPMAFYSPTCRYQKQAQRRVNFFSAGTLRLVQSEEVGDHRRKARRPSLSSIFKTFQKKVNMYYLLEDKLDVVKEDEFNNQPNFKFAHTLVGLACDLLLTSRSWSITWRSSIWSGRFIFRSVFHRRRQSCRLLIRSFRIAIKTSLLGWSINYKKDD